MNDTTTKLHTLPDGSVVESSTAYAWARTWGGTRRHAVRHGDYGHALCGVSTEALTADTGTTLGMSACARCERALAAAGGAAHTKDT